MQRGLDGSYWLVNGFDRGLITVEDAPFIITHFSRDDKGQLIAHDNVTRIWVIDQSRPLWIEQSSDNNQSHPYLYLENNLSAKLSRPAYYDLIENAQTKNEQLGLTSLGAFYPFLNAPPKGIMAP